MKFSKFENYQFISFGPVPYAVTGGLLALLHVRGGITKSNRHVEQPPDAVIAALIWAVDAIGLALDKVWPESRQKLMTQFPAKINRIVEVWRTQLAV